MSTEKLSMSLCGCTGNTGAILHLASTPDQDLMRSTSSILHGHKQVSITMPVTQPGWATTVTTKEHVDRMEQWVLIIV